jgi:hypothetical protein
LKKGVLFSEFLWKCTVKEQPLGVPVQTTPHILYCNNVDCIVSARLESLWREGKFISVYRELNPTLHANFVGDREKK